MLVSFSFQTLTIRQYNLANPRTKFCQETRYVNNWIKANKLKLNVTSEQVLAHNLDTVNIDDKIVNSVNQQNSLEF